MTGLDAAARSVRRPAAGLSARDVIGAWAKLPRRGVIFDFNGTLSDDEPILAEIFTELFAEHLGWEMRAGEYYARLAGRSDREIIEIVVGERIAAVLADHDVAAAPSAAADLTKDLLRRRRELYQRKVAARSPITDATAALVSRLAAAQIPIGIVTGAQRDDVRFVIDRSPVGAHISALIAEEDVARGKPHPEGFLRGASALGLTPREILVFEDSVPGITAATAAGMRCVAVTGTRDSAELGSVTSAVVSRLDPSLLEV